MNSFSEKSKNNLDADECGRGIVRDIPKRDVVTPRRTRQKKPKQTFDTNRT